MKISMQKQHVQVREKPIKIAFRHKNLDINYRMRFLKSYIYHLDDLLRQSLNRDPFLSLPFMVGLLISILLLGVFSPITRPESYSRLNKKNFLFPKDAQIETYLTHYGQLDKILSASQIDPLKTPSKNSAKLTTTIHTVKKGESLSVIAKQYHVSLSTLINFNNITNARRMRAGIELIIPNTDGLLYSVRKGDSLASLTQTYNISQEIILQANGMTSSTLTVGHKIFLPKAALSNWEVRQAIGELFIYPANGYKSSFFGYRRDPFTGLRTFHNGLDIANVQGTSIKAAMEGRVTDLGSHRVYGNYIVINHSGGFRTLYAHLSKFSVKRNTYVNQGQVIGKMGSTGYSTGTHLHFSIFKSNKPCNPLHYLH